MWNEQKSNRFQELRRREQENCLAEEERSELEQLVSEIDEAEAGYLPNATEHLRENREKLERQNRSLNELLLRKQELVSRLRSFIAETQAARNAIDSELKAVLAGSRQS